MIKSKLKEKLYQDPIIIFLTIYYLFPNFGTGLDFWIKISVLSIYMLCYTLKNNHILMRHKLKFFFLNFKIESIILFTFAFYELLILLIQPISFSNLLYLYRPIFFVLILFFTNEMEKEHQINVNKTIKYIYIISFLYYFVSVLQFFNINIFKYIYNDHKSRSFGEIVRLTGLFPNPNMFAWFISQNMIFINLFELKNSKKNMYIGISMVFLLLTGSRSLIILGPLMVLFVSMLKYVIMDNNFKKALKSMFTVLVVFICLVFILIIFKKQLPYAAEILKIFSQGLKSVNSFNSRLGMWDEIIVKLTSERKHILFGLLARNYGSADNDLLYITMRSGIFGLIVQSAFVLFIIIRLIRSFGSKKMKFFILTLLIFSIIVGVQSDTLSGWNFFPVILLSYGIHFNEDSQNFVNIE